MRRYFWLFAFSFLFQSVAYANVALTASDGSGLHLISFKARAVVEGIFAFTEIEMVFHNPEPRQREGRFQITLPQAAAISRFAMSRDGNLLEGEVVERKLAQQAYEDFLHRRQDPALLEVDQGNRFNARIFPIQPKENKRIIISYSQTLSEGSFTLPLKGLPQIKEFSLRIMYDSGYKPALSQRVSDTNAQISQTQILKVDHENYLPKDDFSMTLDNPQQQRAYRSGALLAARIVPFPEIEKPSPSAENWVILLDTSASQTPYLQDSIKALQNLKAALKPASWKVFSFDQQFRAHKTLAEAASVMPLGASNLQQAILELNKLSLHNHRLLIISDTVATAGESAPAKLAELLKSLKGLQRVDILLPGSYHDHDTANALRSSGAHAGVISELNKPREQLLYQLQTPCHTNVTVNVKGSQWFWPQTIDAIQPGEAVAVFAEMSAENPEQKVHISVGGKSFTPDTQPIEPLLLKREWARARIQRLTQLSQQANDPDTRTAFIQQIINVSVTERIVTPYTALLVLESAADYQRYGIKTQAMADILSIGMEGITVVNRQAPPQAVIPMQSPAKPQSNSTDAERDRRAFRVPERKAEENKLLSREESQTIQQSAAPEPMPAMDAAAPAEEAAPMEDIAPLAEPMLAEPMAETESMVGNARGESAGEPTVQRSRVDASRAPAASAPQHMQRQAIASERPRRNSGDTVEQVQPSVAPWTGKYKEFRELLARKQHKAGLQLLLSWREAQPQDVMALIALGEYYQAIKDYEQAARAYGSLLDYFPARADIRRWAAGRLLGFAAGYALALDSLEKAVVQRPDHPSGHYLLAWAYWLNAGADKAIAILKDAAKRNFPRFAGANRILEETSQLIAGETKGEQLRFVLSWETDANDVDFHVYDSKNNHAFYSQPNLKTGGQLYHDITTGYGPENFTIENPTHYPYRLQAHYYSMGPMGYGMGVLHIVRYKQGKITLEFRPFVVMNNQAFVDLGTVKKQ